MYDASEYLKKWVRENITSTTALFHDDTITAGRLVEDCLLEAQGRYHLSEAEVIEAAGGNLLTFMVSELNRAAERESDDE